MTFRFFKNFLSWESICSRSTDTSASSRIGSWPELSHSCGSTERKRSWVSECQAPAQVAGEIAERLQHLGQHGTNVESTDSTHPHNLAAEAPSNRATELKDGRPELGLQDPLPDRRRCR